MGFTDLAQSFYYFMLHEDVLDDDHDAFSGYTRKTTSWT